MLIRLVTVFSALATFLLHAENEQSKWFYRAWQTEDGLPDNSVSAISQSPDGYLWIGTNGGVIRFNGSEFHPLPLRENADLPSQQVHAMLLDRAGRLWLGMERGPLVRIEKDSSHLFHASDGLPGKRVGKICEDLHGRIWANYSGGVVRIEGNKITRFTKKHRIPLGQDSSVVCDVDGQVWMASNHWLGRLNDKGHHLFRRFKSAPLRIAPRRKSGLWIVDESTLFFLKDGDANTHVVDLPAGTMVNAIFEDHLGAIWIGTQKNGLLRVFEKHLEKVPTSHPWISCIQEDQSGNIWAGTKGGGLNLIQTRTASLIEQSAGLPFSSVRSTSCDATGRIWATSLDGQLAYQESGEWHLFTVLPEGTFAQCLSVDPSGTIWLGTKKQGLIKIENKEPISVDVLSTGFVRSILTAKNGDLWVATSQPNRFHRIRNGEIFTFSKPIDFSAVRAITENPDGTIWIGSSNGHLLRVDGDELIDESTIDGLRNLSIRTLHSTPDGSLWIGYAGFGLGHFKNGVYRRFNTDNGLHDNYISQIQHDDDDRLWILANRGLFKVSLKNLLSESNHLYCQFYGRNNALPSVQPSRDFAPSFTRHQNGKLYFSTHQGLLEVTPDDPDDISLPPPILLEKITLNSKPVALFKNRSMLTESSDIVDLSKPDPQLTLPPDHDNLVISFAALNFTAPKNTLIRYRLHPLDKQWQNVDHQSSVTFPRLPAGNYQFELIASNSSGIWSKDGPSVDLIVKPFYWETWWFKMSIGIITALIAGGFVFLGLRRKHQLQLQKIAAREALEQERSRIARDIHDDLGATLTRITLLSESLPETADETTHHAFDKIRSTTRELMSSMDGVVWAINPEHDTFDDLANYLSSFAQELLSVAEIRCRLTFPVDLPERRLSAQLRHNLLLAFKEALNNSVKYAGATAVRISLDPSEEFFVLKIQDDGTGIDPEAPSDPNRPNAGKGMANMEARMLDIGGSCHFKSSPEQGTTVEFKVPFKNTT
ncbi:ATP-binding protein [bacterium]|nr:ATP-binding protein [Akkermansiaceae bacterium]MDB4318141.1 ATP-binding protein [bacterium]MDB4333374.1 ATP-binding protein [Akkermansiaceae bacterium]